MPARIIIHNKNGIYSFELIGSSGEILLQGNTGPSRLECAAAIRSLQVCSQLSERYEKIDLPIGQYYFVVKDRDDNILATSHKFWSMFSRNYALVSVRRECEDAIVVHE